MDYDALTSIEEANFGQAWSTFFLNETHVRAVLLMGPDRVVAVCAAGLHWDGAGWGSTRCATRVRQLTGVALVSDTAKDYIEAFVYSLALAAGVDVPQAKLSPQAGEVAFKLSEVWTTTQSPAPLEEEVKLSWQVVTEPLPADLQLVVQKLARDERLDVKNMLEQIPTFEGLRQRALENNHRQDAKGLMDKYLKGLQQKLLNILRVQVVLHSVLLHCENEDVVALSQQQFLYLLEVEDCLLKERKKLSIPGAVVSSNNN
jgi:hypothetical protein